LAAILADPLVTPPAGPARGDVTVVEYFDSDCPVCRHIEPELRQLLASDPKVRLVHKDWPVFGDASVYAAYCSFAAAREGETGAGGDYCRVAPDPRRAGVQHHEVLWTQFADSPGVRFQIIDERNRVQAGAPI
jgi:Thioredoxin